MSKEVIDWIATEGYKNGEGAVFIGADAETYDIAILAARGLILSGLPKLEVHNFHVLMNSEELDALNKDAPILITNFEPYKNVCDPLEYKQLEAHLHSLLDRSIPVLIHLNAVGERNDCYISSTLLYRLDVINKQFE